MKGRLNEFSKFLLYFSAFNLIASFFVLKELYAQGISAVWVNEGGDKVTQEELRVGQPNGRPVINHIWNGSTVNIKGAKNEVVNFNIVIEAATAQANGVTVAFNTLTGPEGSTIQSTPTSGDGVFNWVNRPIELFYIRYLQIRGLSHFGYETYDERHIPERMRRPWTGEGYGSGTWEDRPDHDKYYPDIAVPLELESPFTIDAERNQSIWVDIYIPKTATAGLYTGNVTIDETGGSTISIPVELTVYDFTLPDIPTGKTMLFVEGSNINERRFGIGNNWVMGENESLAELIQDRHFLIAHRHKISIIGDQSWINSDYTSDDHPSETFAERLQGSFFTSANGYDGPGLNTGNNVYSVGTYGGWQGWGDTEAHMREHSDNWVEWFETNSPETEYFLYLIDESDDYEQIETWSEWLEDNPGPGNRLKSMATISLPRAVNRTPTLKIPASVSNIGIPSEWETSAYEYSHDPNRRFFLYNGSRPAGGGFMIEDDGVALRVNAWIQFKKHINRWFYWEATYYNDYQAGGGRVDLFESAHTFGSFTDVDPVRGETGYNYSNGDGVLLYPGIDSVFPGSSYGVNGPFASLRLKQWRRGLQDHDYLTLASAIDPIAVQGIVDSMIPAVVWEVGVQDTSDPTWVRRDISWSNDPDVWEEARDSLAQIILGEGSGVEEIPYHLYPNAPNPFDKTTTIEYSILREGIVKLAIYDAIGRKIKVLLDGYVPIGTYQIEWDGTDTHGEKVPGGTYFCQMRRKDEKGSSKKMIFLK